MSQAIDGTLLRRTRLMETSPTPFPSGDPP